MLDGARRRSLQRRLHSTSMEGMDPMVRDLVTFGGHTDLRRASRLTAVMRCGAAVLQESAGSANTYDLSEVVETIDMFLSHNWAVPRLTKFLGLILHFNLPIAVLVMVISAAVIVGAQTSMGVTFLGGKQWPMPPDVELKIGAGCTVLVPLLFLLSVFFGHELQRLVGFRGCTVFLDKTCIDQVDQQRQREGILKLGAFLRRSSKMLVLYTDIYLTRLWTVYEVACFLSLHSTSHLIVVPIYQSIVVFSFLAFAYAMLLVQSFFWSVEQWLTILTYFYGLVFTAGMGLFRRFARDMEAIHRRLANFEVGQCTCSCEEDRPLVHNNIARLMRAGGRVGSVATESDALLAFNDFVRARLSRSLAVSIGPIGLRYRQVVLIFFIVVVPWSVDIYLLGVTSSNAEWLARWRIGQAVRVATWVFGVYPLLAALMSTWCGRCLHLSGFQELVFLSAGLALIITVWQVAFGLLMDLAVKAAIGDARDSWAIVQVVVLISLITLAISVYSQGRQVQEEEDMMDGQSDKEMAIVAVATLR